MALLATKLTIIFGPAGLGVLAALVAFGALSDRIGRRPVLAAAIIGIMISMLVFATARGVGWLIVARLIQGFAVGTASTAASAAVIELQPSTRPGLGALTGATAPSLGLASGSLITGLMVDFGPAPTVAVYLALVAVFAGLVVVFLMPETAGQATNRSCMAAAADFRSARAARPVHAAVDRRRRRLGDRRLLSVAWPLACRRASA